MSSRVDRLVEHRQSRRGRGNGNHLTLPTTSLTSLLHSHHLNPHSQMATSLAPPRSLSPGPPPDLTDRFKLKAMYAQLQKDYLRALEVRLPHIHLAFSSSPAPSPARACCLPSASLRLASASRPVCLRPRER